MTIWRDTFITFAKLTYIGLMFVSRHLSQLVIGLHIITKGTHP